jgi:DNA oxidative demethylase
VLGGDTRLAFHGVDRIEPGTSTLLPEGGRINLTLRRVNSFDVDIAAPAGSGTGTS